LGARLGGMHLAKEMGRDGEFIGKGVGFMFVCFGAAGMGFAVLRKPRNKYIVASYSMVLLGLAGWFFYIAATAPKNAKNVQDYLYG